MPTAITLHAGSYGDDDAPAYADGCSGDEGYGPPLPGRRRRLGRRGATLLLALGIAFGLHASLLLLWRASRPPVVPGVVGQGGGSGGISLTLGRGSAGGAFAPSPPSSDVDPQQETEQAAAETAPTPPSTTSSGRDAADSASTGAGHGAGDVGAAMNGGAQASVGSGYDPGAYASLAPLSFARVSDPGLAAQVERCLKRGVPTSVALTVIIDDQGQFLDAYKAVAGLSTNQPPGEVQAIAAAVQALKDCSPYRGLAAGLGRPLTLVVPITGGSATLPKSEEAP